MHTCHLCGQVRPALYMSYIYNGGRRVWLCHPFSGEQQTCFIKVAVFGAKLPDASFRQRA